MTTVDEDARTAAGRRIRNLVIGLVVIGVVLVIPATIFLGAFGYLGLCWDGCYEERGKQIIFWTVMVLPPIAYAWMSFRWVRRLHAMMGDPKAEIPRARSLVWAAAVGLSAVLLALVATCFAALGLLSG